MSSIFESSFPVRTKLLKLCELLLVLLALPLTYKLHGDGPLTTLTVMDAGAGLVGLLVLVSLYFVEFYDPVISVHPVQSVSRILQATGLTLLIVAPFFETEVPFLDGNSLLLGMSMLAGGLAISRCMVAPVVLNPSFAEQALVWGSGPLASSIVRELAQRPDFGIQVMGVIDYKFRGNTIAGAPYLGAPELLWSREDVGHVKRVILAFDDRRGSFPMDKLMAAQADGLILEDAKELYEELTGKVWLDTFSMTELLFSRRLRPSPVGLFFRGAFSVLFAASVLLLSLPVMLITAVLIRQDSSGPVIFRQTRIGKNGQPFTMFKFRSMEVDADRSAPATHDDPRCTRVGKWIRRFRIDELPQLWNILKGDMYLVGPRPFVPEQEDSLVRQIPGYRQRWIVKPGATGWAQVNLEYCSSVEDNIEKLSYDLFYIKHLSLALDMLVLLKTVRVVLLGRGGR